MKIDKDLQNLIPPLASDELQQLESNLLSEGWRSNERIIVWKDTIVDGHNRYNLCTKHNIPFKTQERAFKDKNEAILWMIDNQLGRRNIPDYARGELNIRKAEILRPIADKNLKTATGGKNSLTLPTLAKSIDVREELSKLSKVSHGTFDKIKFIRDNASEDVKAKLRAGNKDISINQAYMDIKRKGQREEAILKANEITPLDTKKKYSIIYADPPWKYFESGHHNQSFHYNTMTIEELKNLPVKDISKDDCILFMWVTFPILEKAFEVINAWGFSYSTCGFNWVKKNKSGEGWFFGLGNWTRANSELCLIATKGKPVRQSNKVFQIIDTPREGHSQKPSVARERIVELMGDLPRIELFAREKTEGWDVYGDEVK